MILHRLLISCGLMTVALTADALAADRPSAAEPAPLATAAAVIHGYERGLLWP